MICRFSRSQLTAVRLLPLTAGLVGLLWVSHTRAAVPVEDMSTRDIRTTAPAVETPQPVTGAVGAPGQNAQLFYELQVLQGEIAQLRGLLEDQAYEVRRLRELQRSQYLDIDRRLTEGGHSVSQLPATASAPQGSVATVVTQPQPQIQPQAPVQPAPVVDAGAVRQVTVPVVQTAGIETPVAEGTQGATPAPAPVVQPKPIPAPETEVAPTEKVVFERAFELMKDQQFAQSIAAYQEVVTGYPDGDYAPESRYWLGELYLMSDQLEAARGSFVSVVEVYPAHQKVPLSLYKLGVVNHRLGATPAALEYLDSVVTRYPDTPAAGLARTYAAELR